MRAVDKSGLGFLDRFYKSPALATNASRWADAPLEVVMKVFCDFCKKELEVREYLLDHVCVVYCNESCSENAVKRNVAAQQSVQPTNGRLCAICGRPEYSHSPDGHDFRSAISGLRKPLGGFARKEIICFK